MSRRCGQQRVRYARDFRNNVDQLSNVSLYSYWSSNYIFHKLPASQARRGGLASTPPDDMLATLFKATFAQTGVDPKDVGDVVIGSVLGPSSQRANECRIAMFLAGMPETVPVHTVNRCVVMLYCCDRAVLLVLCISRDAPARHGVWSCHMRMLVQAMLVRTTSHRQRSSIDQSGLLHRRAGRWRRVHVFQPDDMARRGQPCYRNGQAG